MSKFLVCAWVVSVMVLGSANALADQAKRSNVETTADDEGYGYKFDDDILGAGVTGADTAIIKVRKGAVRRTLIRPRTQFVPELLKSIELL